MKLSELVELINDCESDTPPAESNHGGINLAKHDTVSAEELETVVRACATDADIYAEFMRRVNWIRATNRPLDENGDVAADPNYDFEEERKKVERNRRR